MMTRTTTTRIPYRTVSLILYVSSIHSTNSSVRFQIPTQKRTNNTATRIPRMSDVLTILLCATKNRARDLFFVVCLVCRIGI